MKRYAHPYLFVLVLAGAAVTAGAACVKPGSTASSKEGALKECGPEGLIDDFEDNNNQGAVVEDRGGYWYTYADKEGTTVWPEEGEKGGTFTPSAGGYNSKYAANFKGKIATASVVFGAVGMNFLDPKGMYDGTKFAGFTFFIKRGANSTGKLRVKIPDVNTDPEGQTCSACFNDFGVDLNVGEAWQRVTIPFKDMKQEPEWGAPRRPHMDSSKMFALQWQTKAAGQEYDFWIDNIAFICQGK
jgi:endoglucanase